MTDKKFTLWNRITAVIVFAVSAFTYLSTIEPSASFWDCGEFIASSYKLEVGHPPGNPVFQLFARFFTMFSDGAHAAIMVNAMSALCSALTIFFLYLTIVFLAKRLVRKEDDGSFSIANAVAIFGSGAVGALAYCFSDTFWFSAVEGEVYAMSSLFTAFVFWAMTKWYEQADRPHANRWIVLIAFMMGLSIGVHLLNLLIIPAIVFLYYYKKKEEGKYTWLQLLKIMLISVVILAILVFFLVPYLPKIAAYVDLLFVNVFGLPYNTGAAFFVLAILALCFWGLFRTLKKDKVFWNTALLCLTTIVVGFSLFSICIIRSSVKTPTNEYQPDNAFTLVRYLSREQYGSNPLIYGEYFDAPYEIKTKSYWAPLDGKYKRVPGPPTPAFKPEGKMLFPRMWSASSSGSAYEDFYETYMQGRGRKIAGADHRKPTMAANLAYFFDYQLNWMYWRYFFWNFVGRQNDVHSPTPGNIFHGNWESGVAAIDNIRLGDQSHAPDILSENKAKNHYFFLPLILGLIGLFFQFGKDKRGCWLVFLMFFMTGIAIVIYLNQPPLQVRERDYAYAGSFYSFSIWIGLAVAALFGWISSALKKESVAVSAAVTAVCLCVPVLMAAQNWDDHDRSNRRTAVELASNYLNSVGPEGILITHGDNDTFPLWYAQEVEDVRTDVRICNTSLLGTDWHIDQMKYAVNQSPPLKLSIPNEQLLYGTNEFVYIYDTRDQVIDIRDVMRVFMHPDAKLAMVSGAKVDYIMSRKISVPVNKENVLKYGILSPLFKDVIPDNIVLEIPPEKEYLTKPELFVLDLLSNYEWDRPINFLNMAGDIQVGIKEYLMYDGFSYRLTPIKTGASSTNVGMVDPDYLYNLLMNVFKFDAVSADDYFIDYQNLYTHLGVMSLPNLFVTSADFYLKLGQNDRVKAILDKYCQVMKNYPMEAIPIGLSGADLATIDIIEDYLRIDCVDQARSMALEYSKEILTSAAFYLEFYKYAKADFDQCSSFIYYFANRLRQNGVEDLADQVEGLLDDMVKTVNEAIVGS